jgi:enediyne polyketide synthase
VGAAFVAGVPVRFDGLLAGRPDRPLAVGAELSFFASPCEAAPDVTLAGQPAPAPAEAARPAIDPGTAGRSTLELLRELVAARTELPADAVHEDSRLLDDLHLSSITVGQVLGQAAQELGLPASQVPTGFATATIDELASALDQLRATSRDGDAASPDPVAGVGSWVRPFRIDLVEVTEPVAAVAEPGGAWRVYAQAGHPLAEPLRGELQAGGVGGGVLVCLPPDCQETDLEPALLAAKAAVSQPPGGRFVVVQHGRGAAAIAKTVRLEAPYLRVTVVDTAPVPEAVGRIVADVAATTGFREVYYDAAGGRRVPVLNPLSPRPGTPPLTSVDLLLVTGGGKGITAECAIALARDTGARLALLGRSDPDTDRELAANLARMADAGVTARYARADVSDPAAVRAAVTELAGALGPVTAVLHGAGHNEPASLTSLDMAAFRAATAPKLAGLAAVLDAVDPASLRLLVTFGSIIGRAGMRGEAHYATANDWLAEATVALRTRHPHCRAVCLEWSVWSGTGMGERLSVVESLMREGITPITTDQGVAVLRELLADPGTPPVVVVTGRAEGTDTISYHRPPLPLLRFVEKPLVYYPGVELVVEARLTPDGDPYLEDHLLDGNLLFPAVIGMEAMAQVASSLRGGPPAGPPVLERVVFARPIVVPVGGETVVRVAALATGPDTVDVAIRSSETGFGTDHFRGTLRFAGVDRTDGVPPAAPDLPPVALDPATDLYGDLLFQGGRFRRLLRYRRVAARHAEADVATRDERWFGGFQPAGLLLGDPGARDAFMHGLQVCVPDATLLPAAIERVHLDGAAREAASALTFAAAERSRDGDTYIYDITVRSPAGTVVERWDGLRLQAVRKTDGRGPWPPPLLGPYLQRRLDDLLGVPVAVTVEPDLATDRRAHTAIAVRRALDRDASLRYRPNGRPELDGDQSVTASHGAGVTLAVVGRPPVGCDVEQVVTRPDRAWADLLGPHDALVGLIVGEAGGTRDLAATRVWCALESLQKTGESRGAPLTVQSHPADGWVLFRSGDTSIATFATLLKGVEGQVVMAVAVRGES